MSDTPNTGMIALYTALAAAQSQMVDVQRDRENSHFDSAYASLDAVLREVRPILNANGLVLIQLTSPPTKPDHVSITTRIAHAETGAVLDSVTEIPMGRKSDPQSWGSAHTYARRYGALAIVGLAPTDDDAETAMCRRDEAVSRNDPDARARREEEAAERRAAAAQAEYVKIQDAVDWIRRTTAGWSPERRNTMLEECDAVLNGDIALEDAKEKFKQLSKLEDSK